MNNKTYINWVYFKEIDWQYWKIQLLNIDIKKIDDLKQYVDEKWYIKLKISKRKEADKNWNTHFITLNDYKKEDKKPNNYNINEMPF